MLKSLQVITLGCSKNIVDTEHLLAQIQNDFQIFPENYRGKSDFLLINTCGFIGDAKEESIRVILEAAERKKMGDVGKLVVFGCLSQRYSDSLPELIPEVDAWYGAREFAPIVRGLTGRKIPEMFSTRYRYSTPKGVGYAYLKISEGCNRRCSYCAIPFIRGNHKSVPMEQLVAEAGHLAQNGVKELILIAQDTTYYGMDLYHRRAIAELVEKLSKVEGIEWIRIHYSYPADFPEDLLDQMAGNPKVCKYMDIPLQHVADVVLDNMHRHVDGAWTRELISRMRKRVPGIAIRTTMIVGFPGEGEKEFEELLDFIKEAKFERLGAFRYSEEEGTSGAENFEDNIGDEEKQSRYDRLMSVQNSISLECNESRVGTVEKVIVDAVSDGALVCRSQYESPEVDGEIFVRYEPECFGGQPAESFVGQFLQVKITGAEDYDLHAELYK